MSERFNDLQIISKINNLINFYLFFFKISRLGICQVVDFHRLAFCGEIKFRVRLSSAFKVKFFSLVTTPLCTKLCICELCRRAFVTDVFGFNGSKGNLLIQAPNFKLSNGTLSVVAFNFSSFSLPTKKNAFDAESRPRKAGRRSGRWRVPKDEVFIPHSWWCCNKLFLWEQLRRIYGAQLSAPFDFGPSTIPPRSLWRL